MKKKSFYYITFNDNFSGIFSSQVIDVLNLYKGLGYEFKLIAFVSIRSYLFNRRSIKKQFNNSSVLPSFPKLKFWRFNKFWFLFFNFKNSISICRGIFATNLLLNYNSDSNCKIIYDGRGAISAESEEYEVFKGTGVENQILNLEKNAVLKSDFKISVTTQLVKFWENKFDYSANNHVIIPCTFQPQTPKIDINRDKFGFKASDIIMVFSGTNSLWHSFDLMIKNIKIVLNTNSNVKCLILSNDSSVLEALKTNYKDRIISSWVQHKEVMSVLKLCDYGYVYREDKTTNKVASPVKVAEYLGAGLKVIISKNIIDYSNIIKDNNLGFNIDEINKDLKLDPVSVQEKNRISDFAVDNFSKNSTVIKKSYNSIIDYFID